MPAAPTNRYRQLLSLSLSADPVKNTAAITKKRMVASNQHKSFYKMD